MDDNNNNNHIISDYSNNDNKPINNTKYDNNPLLRGASRNQSREPIKESYRCVMIIVCCLY